MTILHFASPEVLEVLLQRDHPTSVLGFIKNGFVEKKILQINGAFVDKIIYNLEKSSILSLFK